MTWKKVMVRLCIPPKHACFTSRRGPSMRRVIVICVLAAISVYAQRTGAASSGQASPPAQKPQTPGTAQPPRLPAVQLPPDAVVISIHGVCADHAGPKSDACVTNITREQFDRMIAAMSFNSRVANNPVAVRSFAQSYAQELALADAAEKAGVDKDPQFQELMKIVRTRTLADTFQRMLLEKYGNPPQDQVEAYYKQNQGKFEQIGLDRIFVPRFNSRDPKGNPAEFEKKAQQVTEGIRQRAANGQDMNTLQAEAYKILGLTPPMTTDLGSKRVGTFPSSVEQAIAGLKTGEVSKVQSEPGGFTIYKVRSRDVVPLSIAQAEIVQEISNKNREAT